MRLIHRIFLAVFLSLLTASIFGQTSNTTTNFEPLEHWRQAVLTGDSAALQASYSTQPPVVIKGPITAGQGTIDELQFWKERKEAGLTRLTFDDLDIKPGEDTK